jgi:antitoxin ParD1/3/4
MNVNLGATFDAFVAELLESGQYQSQSEVIRDALRLLKEREDLKRLRLGQLRKEIQAGLDSGGSEPLDIDTIKAEGRKRLAKRRKSRT